MPRLFAASGIFHPEPGGPATYLYEALPALQVRGWEVRLLTFGEGGGSYPYPVTRVPRVGRCPCATPAMRGRPGSTCARLT
jgi:hypothetical protein